MTKPCLLNLVFSHFPLPIFSSVGPSEAPTTVPVPVETERQPSIAIEDITDSSATVVLMNLFDVDAPLPPRVPTRMVITQPGGDVVANVSIVADDSRFPLDLLEPNSLYTITFTGAELPSQSFRTEAFAGTPDGEGLLSGVCFLLHLP